MTRANSKQRGFTLIELMVVVAIVAVIAGIAISSFSGAGDEANRSRGMADITALNDAVGRYYQTGYTYTGATLAGLTAAAGLNLTNQYTFNVVVAADGQSYSVQAVPAAGESMVGDGALSVNNVGNRCYFPGDDAPNFNTCPHAF